MRDRCHMRPLDPRQGDPGSFRPHRSCRPSGEQSRTPARGKLGGQPDWNRSLRGTPAPQSRYRTARPGFPGVAGQTSHVYRVWYRPAPLRTAGQRATSPCVRRERDGAHRRSSPLRLSVHGHPPAPVQTCAVSSVQARCSSHNHSSLPLARSLPVSLHLSVSAYVRVSHMRTHIHAHTYTTVYTCTHMLARTHTCTCV